MRSGSSEQPGTARCPGCSSERAPERDAPAYAPARTEQREAFLEQAAGTAKLPRDEGLRLWELAGGERGEPVSRLGAESQQGATLASAAAHARARQLPAFRLTVSLRNLSGLNERLGHSGADAFYASAAEILDRRVHALDADVNGFRSQGTMTFAVVARSSRTGASTLRSSILDAMRDAAAHVRGVAGGNALGKLPGASRAWATRPSARRPTPCTPPTARSRRRSRLGRADLRARRPGARLAAPQ